MSSALISAAEEELERRKRAGDITWDEMWDGVLHMSPLPGDLHQDLASELSAYLTVHWAEPRSAKVFGPVNLAMPGAGKDWVNNFRCADLELLTRDRFHIRRGSHWEGAPNVVIEIYSPGDEAYEKLGFYFDLGVPELWIIDPDSGIPELYVRKRTRYQKAKADSDGWLHSPETSVEFRPGPRSKLRIRIAGKPRTQRDLPKD